MTKMRAEIRELTVDKDKRADLSESEDVETVTETFDTERPADPETGVPPLKTRRTERRTRRSKATIEELSRVRSASIAEERDSIQATSSSDIHESTEAEAELEEDILESSPNRKGELPWWQKTLMICGGSALALLALQLFKPRLKGFLSVLKTIFRIK